MNIIRSVSSFGFLTLLSRILGYLRDILIAIFVGTTTFADAFFVAFRLPNTFRRLFAEGTFNAAFVPIYSNLVFSQKEKNFTNSIFNFLLIFLLILVLIAEIFNFSEILKLIESNQLELNQKNKSEVIDFFDSILNQILGLNYKKEDPKNDSLIKVLLKIRNDARSNKDFEYRDAILLDAILIS